MSCDLCRTLADDHFVIIAYVPSNSGPDWIRYAHAKCAESRDIRPVDLAIPVAASTSGPSVL